MRNSPSPEWQFFATEEALGPVSSFPLPALLGIPHRQLCQLDLGPLEERGRVAAGWGRAGARWGLQGGEGQPGQLSGGECPKKEGERESGKYRRGSWCLACQCREVEGAQGQDDVRDAGLGKKTEWSAEPQAF